MNSSPEVSVIIPVFKATATLADAIASVQNTTVEIEIIVSVDDGCDYSFALDLDPRIILVASHQTQTGPGATRNRAIAMAKAPYLAYLDADDTWSPHYLETLLPLARLAGCAFASTAVFNPLGELIIQMPNQGSNCLIPKDFGHWGASFHPVHASHLPRGAKDHPFYSAPAQDVMHAVEVLLACGTDAPLAMDVCYQIQLSQRSVTTADNFAQEVRKAYLQYDAALQGTAAEGLFLARATLNDRYVRDAKVGETFYEFVSRMQA